MGFPLKKITRGFKGMLFGSLGNYWKTSKQHGTLWTRWWKPLKPGGENHWKPKSLNVFFWGAEGLSWGVLLFFGLGEKVRRISWSNCSIFCWFGWVWSYFLSDVLVWPFDSPVLMLKTSLERLFTSVQFLLRSGCALKQGDGDSVLYPRHPKISKTAQKA